MATFFSNLAAGLSGSCGMAAGANIGDGVAVCEACQGEAPDIVGKGILSSVALVLSGAQLLGDIASAKEANMIREAIRLMIEAKVHLAADLGGSGITDTLKTATVDEFKKILVS
jgi:isocitrate dehydrogenase (NAD+)